MYKFFSFFLLILFFSCSNNSTDPTDNTELPEIVIRDGQIFEQETQNSLIIEVAAFGDITDPITFQYNVEGLTAEAGVDFTATSGTGEITAAATTFQIQIPILPDDEKEVNEKLQATLSNVSGATITNLSAVGLIKDNDEVSRFDADGYLTANNHYGYTLSWADEFDGNSLDPNNYNFELEDGCPNLCGWGNNELQWYRDIEENVFVADGKFTIRATNANTADYYSARVTTEGKKFFEFGRIDIRAKLPYGQGIWPAIWMLGENIDEIGWPACGEIDIMELVGHEPNIVHGTAHWGPAGRGYSTFEGSSFVLDEDFSEQFHVFTLVWEFNELNWYVDETLYHTITPGNMQGEEYRFNNPFFFIFNIAVGGQWPGNPDATTEFPQVMEIDYVRVFQ